MTDDLVECLASLPSLVCRLDSRRVSDDLNEVEFLMARSEEYLELMLTLAGKLRLQYLLC